MRLKVLLPGGIMLEEEISRVIAEAENGFFCLLPRHVDFVAALVPGLFSFASGEGEEEFLAMDEGILVKCGPQVVVSTRHAVRGGDLGSLRQTVVEQFGKLDEREKMTRSILARLEADFVRRFLELERWTHA